MRRRIFLAGAVGAIALPVAAGAQQKTLRLIGLLSPFTREETEPWHRAFRQGLSELGWNEGNDIRFEYRYSDGHHERLPALVADLLKLKPDVIVTAVTTDTAPAAKATRTIPIVMASPGDPVSTGLIASLAHPGGNVTGLTQVATDLAAKRLQLLKEVAPGTTRIGVLRDPDDPVASLIWRELEEAGPRLGITLHSLEVRTSSSLDTAFAQALVARSDALTVLPTPIFVVNARRIAEFAQTNRLPSIFHPSEFVHAGGLLSYGPDRSDLFRRATAYVDKILKGANPSDLPVERPTKFQLVVNLKTAEAIGLKLPSGFLSRADEIIE